MNKVKHELMVDIEAYPEDFFIRHRQLAENANKVLFIHTPRCQGKSWTDKLLQMSLGVRFGGKTQTALQWWADECDILFTHKRTKLLQSKSKQPRWVYVTISENKRYYEEK